MSRERILVGMSGGVDSSVAALLLRDAGHEVIGATMLIYGGDLPGGSAENACYGAGEEKDVEEAEGICRAIGIPYRAVDLRTEYREEVLAYFRREYLAGRTPNPCVRCNGLMKFGLLVEKLSRATGLEFDRFATGHYARVAFDPASGRHQLLKGADEAKDQSYFLCLLTQENLARAVFPLGGMTKAEVRRIARERGLATHDKPDSQNFAAGDYRALLESSGAVREGPIRNARGEMVGTHRGLGSYTIGQRRGLGISGGDPLYVTEIDAESNTVWVGGAGELERRNLLASGVNWVSRERPAAPFRAGVRIRSRHREADAAIDIREDGSAHVLFDEPQRSIARGQYAVIYEGDLLVAGGIIEDSW